MPDVQIPDFVMSYMSGPQRNLVRNAAGVSCTNSVHSVRVRDHALATKLLARVVVVLRKVELRAEGHALGGGMLKLEPREAGRIVFPSTATIVKKSMAMN